MPNAIVLLSGGLDSTTCLGLATSEGYDCYALSFDYGQKHIAELNASKRVAEFFNVKHHHIMDLHSLGAMGASSLTSDQYDIPKHSEGPGIPSTYVPARNTVFLAAALGWAEIVNASAVFIGVSAVDYSGYPDCRPEFIEAFQNLANLATKQAIEGNPIHIKAPLMHLNKAKTIQLGLSVGVDYSLTVTCYKATDDGLACGECSSCYLRKKGFNDAQLHDPTRYNETA